MTRDTARDPRAQAIGPSAHARARGRFAPTLSVDRETIELDAPIAVLASGQRCGSTLIQRLLSSHPDVLIWGEHAGQLRTLRDIGDILEWWDGLLGAPARESFARDAHDSFMANLVPELDSPLVAAARAYVLELFARPAAAAGARRWGLKEVRYGVREALWLRRLFPGLKVVHVTRDPRSVLISLESWERSVPGWGPGETQEAMVDWVRVNAGFLACDDLLPWVLRVRYEEIAHDSAELVRRLGRFLELDPEGFDRQVFDRQLPMNPLDLAAHRALKPFGKLPKRLRRAHGSPELARLAAALGYDG